MTRTRIDFAFHGDLTTYLNDSQWVKGYGTKLRRASLGHGSYYSLKLVNESNQHTLLTHDMLSCPKITGQDIEDSAWAITNIACGFRDLYKTDIGIVYNIPDLVPGKKDFRFTSTREHKQVLQSGNEMARSQTTQINRHFFLQSALYENMVEIALAAKLGREPALIYQPA